MAKETFYFKHDYNSRNDPKLVKLIRSHGMAGIGIFWCMNEMMYEQGGQLPMDFEDLAFELRSDSKIIESIVSESKLYENDGKVFWSNSVRRRLDERKSVADGRKAAAEARWNKKGDANAMQMHSKSNAIKGKKRKVEESKEKDRKGETRVTAPHPPEDKVAMTVQVREKSFAESLVPHLGAYSKELVRAFYDYWRERTQSGKKMRFELEKTWDVALRLKKWQENDDKWSKPKSVNGSDHPDAAAERMERLLAGKPSDA